MDHRQRLFRVLDGESVDRVPIWLLFPYHPLGCYVDVRTHPLYRQVFEESKRYAVMLNRRNLGVPLYTVGEQSERIYHQGDQQIVEHHWHYERMHFFGQMTRSPNGTRVKKLLDTAEDLEKLAQIPVNTDKGEIYRALDQVLPQYLQEKREFPERYGAMMLDLGEPIGFLYQNSNLEEFSMWSVTHADLVLDLLHRFMAHKRIVYQYCLERDLADVYFMVGSELASPPLVSRQTFQQWIVPFAAELVDLVHGFGKKVIMHYHGQIKEILPDFVTMGPDALHTIEAPPVGDCTFTEAFAIVKDRIVLIGNIQYDCFRSYTADEMAQAVQELQRECRGKRWILSPTAGPYDPDVSQAFIDNYLTFLRVGACAQGPGPDLVQV